METARILLVEDEEHIAQGIIFNLEQEGYLVEHVITGEAALERLQASRFSLIILDLMLPGMHGLAVCRHIRKSDPVVPILMLTAMGEESDRVNGLLEGADDYLSKPFNLMEFLLRVKGMLRRVRLSAVGDIVESYHFGDNIVHFDKRRAETITGEIELTDLELRMLRVFFDNEGKVLSRAQLLESVWGVSPDTETRTLDNFVVRLRRYFEKDAKKPAHFLTVRGRGYRFVSQF